MRLFLAIVFFLISLPTFSKSGDVTEYSLANGLRLLVKEDHRAPIAIAQIWYKVGSSYESNGLTGISHALEHMMFHGTKKYGHGVLDKIIVDNGGVHNAYTDADFTVYLETISADKLPIVFDLEADRMCGLLLDDKEAFTTEMQAIVEERKMRTEDNPDNLVFERFMAMAFASNPYHSPIIGWMHDIQNLTQEDLKLWYKNWYAPNNAIVVVVGDVQPDKIFKLVQQYFSSIPSVSNLAKSKPQKEITPLGERKIVVKVPAKVPFLILGYNVPVLKTIDQKWKAYALDAAQSILSNGASSRLEKELVRKQKIAASVDVSYDIFSRLDNLFVFSGIPASGHTVDELREAWQAEVKKLQTTLVTQQELARIKAQIISGRVYKKDSIEYQAQEIGSLETVGLSWREADQYLENINKVTPEQIKQVVEEYLVPERLTHAELQPIQQTAEIKQPLNQARDEL